MAKKPASNSKNIPAVGKPSSLVDTKVIYCKGFFVAFDYSSDAMSEIQSFFKKSGKSIIALTVKDILDEQIAYKLT